MLQRENGGEDESGAGMLKRMSPQKPKWPPFFFSLSHQKKKKKSERMKV